VEKTRLGGLVKNRNTISALGALLNAPDQKRAKVLLSQTSPAPVFCIWLLEGDIPLHLKPSLGAAVDP
jgi:hypothetical protein